MNLTIGDVARQTGVKVTTIRFYETRNILPVPNRSPAGRRTYSQSDVARLTFIKHARALGFDLDAIRALLELSDEPGQNCAAADSIARQQLDAVTQRIAQLEQLRFELRRMVRECHGDTIDQCAVIESLADHGKCDTEHAFMPENDFRPTAR